MKFRQQNTAIGLDVGQSYARLIKLKRSGKKFTVERAEELNIEAEGILDETELFSDAGLGKWLKEKKLDTMPICLGLPQYLCTTRIVNDFKANAKQEQLEQMVQFETTQLAGLSEETFISDYQRMTPAYGVEAPIIIGFGREAGSNEMAEKCSRIPIKLGDLAMGSFAIANAFCYLHPEELESDTVQVLIDLGTENSTIVIMVHGNVVYTGSMMFGGKRFTQVLAATMECTEAEAEKLKQDYVPDWEDNESPYIFATRQLETELRTSIDNWRSGEIQALADLEISKIWLCGGAARTIGLAEHIQRIYGCPVELLGPSINSTAKSPKKDSPAKPNQDSKEKDSPAKPETTQETTVTPQTQPVSEDATPKETLAEPTSASADDEVPEGISQIFSSIKIKVNVPPSDGETESIDETPDVPEDESSADSTELPRTIRVKLPLPEEEVASESPDEAPRDAETLQQSSAISLAKPEKPNVKATSLPDIAPEFTIAFGLALQTTGYAAYPISLAPMLRRWQIQREDRIKYLILAVFFLCVTLAGSMLAADYWLGLRIEELNEGMEELHECDKLVPKLDNAISQIEYQQQLLLPFVELGGRSKTFMKALTVIDAAKGERDWCFYFADQFSYEEHNVPAPKEEPKRQTKTTVSGDMFGGTPQKEQKPAPKEEQKLVLDSMPLLTSMVMAGYTPVEKTEDGKNVRRYVGVVNLQKNLRPPTNEEERKKRTYETIFNDQVDTMEVEWQGKGINLELGWNQYLKSRREQLGEFTEFKLSMPLTKKQVDIPPPKEPPKKAKKK